MNYVIIGNSAAGISAIEAIRVVDKKGKITVISKDKQRGYSPALTTYFISGKTDEKNIYYRDKDFYKENKVKLMLGKEVVSINPKKKEVSLSSGKKVPYGKLLIAVGAKPIIPPIEGIKQKGVFTLRNLSNAQNILDYSKGKDDVLIIGGGLVGLRAAYALEQMGKKITVVEIAKHILPQNLDETAAGIIEDFLTEKGWEIVLGKSVSALKGNKLGVQEAVLSDNTKISTRLVIIGTGVRPDIKLAETAGIKTNQGIVVDSNMRTNIKDIKDSNIFAAGDVVEARDMLLGKRAVNAIWPLAVKQGRVAGFNMAEENTKYESGFPMNSIDFYGLTTMSVGRSDLRGIKKYQKKSGNTYRKIGIRDNKLVHFILTGNVDRAGMLTSLINERIDVSSFKRALLDEDFGFLNMPEKTRKNKLTSTSNKY